jgi:3-(3-hydroxy-phenyl)propionate hydroxylase
VAAQAQSTNDSYQFRRCREQAGSTVRHRVAILGAGPVGLCAAIGFALHGVETVVIDARDGPGQGSRAICWSKRTLEICDRLGTGDALVARGVTWSEGKVYVGDAEVYGFDLLPETGHRRPAFINLQQFHFEGDALLRAASQEAIELRWQHQAVAVRPHDEHVEIDVETPAGAYTLLADWLIACDGVRSTARRSLGLDFAGRVFEDRFLIADIRMNADFPAIRRFWFDPTFSDGKSALMHKQADNVWRCDFQLGADADPVVERSPERVATRLHRMLGNRPFEIVWTSVYTFACRRLERFRHGRVFFAGDSAHVVSPFGARGGNSGIEDADNLVWKLAAVLDGDAPDALLDSYDAERVQAAEENIAISTRTTDFIAPKSEAGRIFRDAVLDLAHDFPFARRMVNSGRLSTPANYAGSPLNNGDDAAFAGGPSPGEPCPDAPAAGPRGSWLLDHLGGEFVLLAAGEILAECATAGLRPAIRPLVIDSGKANGIADTRGRIAERYALRPGSAYLIRPDQYVAARWSTPPPTAIAAALDRALARSPRPTVEARHA